MCPLPGNARILAALGRATPPLLTRVKSRATSVAKNKLWKNTLWKNTLRKIQFGKIHIHIFEEHCCHHTFLSIDASTPRSVYAFLKLHPQISVCIPLRPSVYVFEEHCAMIIIFFIKINKLGMLNETMIWQVWGPSSN